MLLGRKGVRGLWFGLGSLHADLRERRLNVVQSVLSLMRISSQKSISTPAPVFFQGRMAPGVSLDVFQL